MALRQHPSQTGADRIMSWQEHHQQAEHLADGTTIAAHRGQTPLSRMLHRRAAMAEIRDLAEVKPEHLRTRGITAVSAAACYLKGGQNRQAAQFAQRALHGPQPLPQFARHQLQEIIIAARQQARPAGSHPPEPEPEK